MEELNIAQRITKLRKEQYPLRDSYYKYLQLEREIEAIKRKCEHENAYYVTQWTDSYECRTYDVNICPDCGEQFETRCFRGKHVYISKEEYDKIHENKEPEMRELDDEELLWACKVTCNSCSKKWELKGEHLKHVKHNTKDVYGFMCPNCGNFTELDLTIIPVRELIKAQDIDIAN